MLRKIQYRWKKNVDNVIRAAQQDACMQRPKDNPYRRGTPEHALYERTYERTVESLAEDVTPRQYSKWPPRRGAIRRSFNGHRYGRR